MKISNANESSRDKEQMFLPPVSVFFTTSFNLCVFALKYLAHATSVRVANMSSN